MRKLTTFLFAILSSLIFTACGSGSGSDSSTSQVPSIGGRTTDGDSGGTTGGNGNAAYYGIATDSSTPITNQPALPTNGSLMSIPNEFAVNIRNLNTRTMDVFIYQPTCVVGLLTEDYSIVLISGSQTAPTIGQLSVGASSISFQERSIFYSGWTPSAYDFGSTSILSGTCSSGQMSLNKAGTLFSNGKILIWRTAS